MDGAEKGEAAPLIIEECGGREAAEGSLGGVGEGVFGEAVLERGPELGEEFLDAGSVGAMGAAGKVGEEGQELGAVFVEGVASQGERGATEVGVVFLNVERKGGAEAAGVGLFAGEGVGVGSAAAAEFGEEAGVEGEEGKVGERNVRQVVDEVGIENFVGEAGVMEDVFVLGEREVASVGGYVAKGEFGEAGKGLRFDGFLVGVEGGGLFEERLGIDVRSEPRESLFFFELFFGVELGIGMECDLDKVGVVEEVFTKERGEIVWVLEAVSEVIEEGMDEESVLRGAAVLQGKAAAEKEGEAKGHPFGANFCALKFKLVQGGFDFFFCELDVL